MTGVQTCALPISLPLDDFQRVGFDGDGVCYMNLNTFIFLCHSSSIQSNVCGEFMSAASFPVVQFNLKLINDLLRSRNLPSLCLINTGYWGDESKFFTYVPNDSVIFVKHAKRNDCSDSYIGEYRMTKNINKQDTLPGPSINVVLCNNPRDENDSLLEVHSSHAGGAICYRPQSSVVKLLRV